MSKYGNSRHNKLGHYKKSNWNYVSAGIVHWWVQKVNGAKTVNFSASVTEF